MKYKILFFFVGCSIFSLSIGRLLNADQVVIGTDFTSVGIIDGDLIVSNGSIRTNDSGDLIVNGDVKVMGGSVFLGPLSGKFLVQGDLIVTNTFPAGDASIITHDALDVKGSIIVSSVLADATISTTGGGSSGTLQAESISTHGLGAGFIYAGGDIAVVGEINTHSTNGDGSVRVLSGADILAGRVITDALTAASVVGDSVTVVGEISTLSRNVSSGSSSVFVSSGNLYASTITTSGGSAGVTSSSNIEVDGAIKTFSMSPSSDCDVLALNNISAGSISTVSYNDDGRVIASNGYIRVDGDITTRGGSGDNSNVSAKTDLYAVNVINEGGYTGVSATNGIDVLRGIITRGDGASQGGIAASSGGVRSHFVNTDWGINVDDDVDVSGPIHITSPGGTAQVRAGGGVSAKSIRTDGNTVANVQALSGFIKVKDDIRTRSSGGTASIYGRQGVEARTIVSDLEGATYVYSPDGDISVLGDIESMYVFVKDGSISARSLTLGPRRIGGSGIVESDTGGLSRFKLLSVPSNYVENCEFFFDSDVEVDGTLDVYGSCTIDGNGNNMLFEAGGEILVHSGAQLTLKNVFLDGLAGNALRCVDNTGVLFLRDVSWTQDGDFVFSNGAMRFYGDCSINGPDTVFIYDSVETSSIDDFSTLSFSYGLTVSYDSTNDHGIAMESSSSVLKFDGSFLYVVDDFRIMDGSLVIDNKVSFSVDVGKTLFYGNGFEENNPEIDHTIGSEFSMYGKLEDERFWAVAI